MSNPTKPTLKTEIIPVAIMITIIIASFYFYVNFPERVPTHWNFAGEPDSWSGRGFAAFFFPALIVGLYLLLLGLPYIDPLKKRYQEFVKVYHVIKATMVIFLAALYVVASLNGLGYKVPINITVLTGVGLLFIILGYFMKQIKPNWFIGIRTPWTLSSEKVWKKTHQLGGKVFMLAGLLMIVGAFLPGQIFGPIFIVAVIILVLVPVVYSYLVYRI